MRTGNLAVPVVVVALFAPAGVGDGARLVSAGPAVIAPDARPLLAGQLADGVPIGLDAPPIRDPSDNIAVCCLKLDSS